MTRLRVLLVTATIAGPIALSLAALVLGRMLWPFSDYPMYSDLAGPTVSVTRAVGVEPGGRERPLPPQVEPTGLVLHLDVNHASRSSDAPARLTRIATAMWTEYERLRAAGGVDGPPITAVRIYRDTIQLATRPHVRRAALVTQGPMP
jgi:hypothetical protein